MSVRRFASHGTPATSPSWQQRSLLAPATIETASGLPSTRQVPPQLATLDGQELVNAFENVFSWRSIAQEQTQSENTSFSGCAERTLTWCKIHDPTSPTFSSASTTSDASSVERQTSAHLQRQNTQGARGHLARLQAMKESARAARDELHTPLPETNAYCQDGCHIDAQRPHPLEDDGHSFASDLRASAEKRSSSCDSCEALSSASTSTGSLPGDTLVSEELSPNRATPKEAAASVADAAQILAEETDDMAACAVLNRCTQEKISQRVIDALTVASGNVSAVLSRPDVDVASDSEHETDTAQALSCHKNTLQNLIKVQKHCMQVETLIRDGVFMS